MAQSISADFARSLIEAERILTAMRAQILQHHQAVADSNDAIDESRVLLGFRVAGE